MVKIMENPIKIDDMGVPLFFGNTHLEDSGQGTKIMPLRTRTLLPGVQNVFF